MQAQRNKQARGAFYLLWLALSLVQAYGSNLIPDEAYYWRYSRDLAWGYFDHPPVIALLIRAGDVLWHSEVGVRLASILLTMGTIFLTERLTRPRDAALYYLAVSSVAVLHIAGILAVPDIPLLFFTAAFFYLYRQYCERERWYHIFLLAGNVALLLLSKYHGILVVGFTLLSHPRLLRRPSLWAIATLGAALFLPHVLWQHMHGYPSVLYHLSGRNATPYNVSFTLSYLGVVPLLFAPATGIVLLYLALKRKATDTTERAMRVTLWGTLLFFLAMSFRGRIEGNWILFLVIPVLALGYKELEQRQWSGKFIRISFLFTSVLVMAGRILLLDGVAPFRNDCSGWKDWAAAVHHEAKGETVAFMNSYQKAAEYEFYTGGSAFSLNNIMGRKDQYGLWNTENNAQGKTVLLICNYPVHDSLGQLATRRDTPQYLHIRDFRSSSRIYIELTELKDDRSIGAGDTLDVGYSIGLEEGATLPGADNPDYPMRLTYQFTGEDGQVTSTATDELLTAQQIIKGSHLHVPVPAPAHAGRYYLSLSVRTGWLPPSINGGKKRVTVR
ncbi:MAG: glycosyltransferase family 39 protein [Flavipsychrobacter sp.]|nr:glycosyltransferase family 39 protein [Flavipsychrobacter sp.]